MNCFYISIKDYKEFTDLEYRVKSDFYGVLGTFRPKVTLIATGKTGKASSEALVFLKILEKRRVQTPDTQLTAIFSQNKPTISYKTVRIYD